MKDGPDLPPDDVAQIRKEIAAFIRSALADEGTAIDAGGGFGGFDLWFTVGGIEYVLTVSRSEKP